MPCRLSQPSVSAEGHFPDDIEKLVGFILHGVTHMLDDGKIIHRTYFATINEGESVAVVDTRQLPTLDIEQSVVHKLAEEHKATMLACLSEAWTLPEELREAQRNGTSGYATIEDHPEKYEIMLITVEHPDGVWLMHCRLNRNELGKRVLPETVHFEKMAEDVRPHPEFVPLLPQQAPAGVTFH